MARMGYSCFVRPQQPLKHAGLDNVVLFPASTPPTKHAISRLPLDFPLVSC